LKPAALLNTLLNMSDSMPASTNLTRRGKVWHFCLRVPADVAPHLGKSRIQFSLRTVHEAEARRLALAESTRWQERFDEVRSARGLIAERPVAGALDTTGWTWPDWQALADWIEAVFLEEDLSWRLRRANGSTLVDPARLQPLGLAFKKAFFRRKEKLRDITAEEYGRTELARVQRYVARLGCRVVPGGPYFDRFMVACLAAEMRVVEKLRDREWRRTGFDHIHPDLIEGPWRRPPAKQEAVTAPSINVPAPSGYSFDDCLSAWERDRERAKKPINQHHVADMKAVLALFQEHSGICDIGQAQRRHVIAFRDAFVDAGELMVSTINKKVGYVTTMSKVAQHKGWIDECLGDNYYLDVPADEDRREAYTSAQLERIFGHRLFTEGWRPKSRKALGEFAFWFPLISITSGLITSEAGQLGPDTVGPHPDDPSILVMTVTTAGSRTVKVHARKRAVPIRKELLDLGFMDLAVAARRDGRRTLWKEAEEVGWPLASNYFSSFWTTLIQDDLMLEVEDQTLYSLRHSFQDGLTRAGFGDCNKALMGHSEGGMTPRYGQKKDARAVPILRLNEAVQAISWPWLRRVALRDRDQLA
jgi:hypothetical protein